MDADPKNFPDLESGYVIRAHNVKMEPRDGVMTGRVFSAHAILVVPGRVGDPITPVSTARSMIFTEFDKYKGSIFQNSFSAECSLVHPKNDRYNILKV
jgi:hypothetical protein